MTELDMCFQIYIPISVTSTSINHDEYSTANIKTCALLQYTEIITLWCCKQQCMEFLCEIFSTGNS